MDALRGTTGAVIRDSGGNFIVASNTRIDHAHDAITAEAMALKQGLLLAQSMGCNRLIINSDCMEVINTMLDGGQSHGVAAAVLDDCYHLAREFVKKKFEHVTREGKSESCTTPKIRFLAQSI